MPEPPDCHQSGVRGSEVESYSHRGKNSHSVATHILFAQHQFHSEIKLWDIMDKQCESHDSGIFNHSLLSSEYCFMVTLSQSPFNRDDRVTNLQKTKTTCIHVNSDTLEDSSKSD